MDIEEGSKMSEVIKNVLDLFNVMVTPRSVPVSQMDFDSVKSGFITNFVPTMGQYVVLTAKFAPLPITTLFTVEERDRAPIERLLARQILHYIEVYGLNAPGLFGLEQTNGTVANITFVRGVSVEELSELVVKLLTTNAPVKDATVIKQIIDEYKIEIPEISKIVNNELRVILFNVDKHRFTNGDDAVRYMCYKATGETLLIKSKKVVDAVKAVRYSTSFLETHAVVLAQVFNRHKRLILAAKGTAGQTTVINKIARMSKKLHVPINEGFNKQFVSVALAGTWYDPAALEAMSLRDRFKFLNLLEYKKQQHSVDAFVIRNGRVHVEPNRPHHNIWRIERVINEVVSSLNATFSNLLIGKNILLDARVDYGLPISRKQMVGKLPFGTTVTVDNVISSGIYWHNDGGARDLDLSAIDTNGQRTGWGQYSGYDNRNPVTYSGDVTSAHNGAMEFLTSKTSFTQSYGIFVNIFNGAIGSKAEVVVGTKTRDRWIDDTVVREQIVLPGKGSIIGFVRDGKYVAYSGVLNNNAVSGNAKSQAIVARGTAQFWTVRKLFDTLGVLYDTERQPDVEYDYDLTYSQFSVDKLEKMFEGS